MNAAVIRSTRRAYLSKIRLKKTLWLILFFVVILFPVVVILVTNLQNNTWREWQRDLASCCGYLGLSLMILSFIPITRERYVTNSFNMDSVYKFHHAFSTIGFWLATAHLVILWINNFSIASLLNVFSSLPLYTKAGTLALFAAALLVYFSYSRKELKINYDFWKIGHSLIAIAMVVFGMIHILGINYYTKNPLIYGYYVLLVFLAVCAIFWLRLNAGLIELQKPYKIVDVRVMNNSTTEITLEFVGSEKQKPVAYRAGQIAWITVRRSPFAFRKHPFSIASSDVNQKIVKFAIRELGDFTSTIKDMKVGERVYIEGGFGTFDLDKLGDEGFVIIAGGIGIAPAMSIVRTMAEKGDKRKVVLFYGSRDVDSIGFYQELTDLSKKMNLEVVHVLERTDDPKFEKGYITTDVLRRHFPKNKDRYDVFICGPAPMLEIVQKSMKEMGIPKDNIWEEYYNMA
jgi:predicted ferric reductase